MVLREIDRDRHHVDLCLDHDPDTASATTRDGSLRIFVAAGALCFSVNRSTSRGRLAIELARQFPSHREVSVCAAPIRWFSPERDRCTLLVVEARLIEISLVPSGGCPGTWCELTP